MSEVLKVRNVETMYGRVMAIRGVSLSVREGTVVTVMGSNGAGKTTLMNCLAGVYRPDEGHVRIDGQEMRFSSPADALAAGIGMVPLPTTSVPPPLEEMV